MEPKHKIELDSTDNPNITVGLDIGTSKICALVAARDESPNKLKILGIGITDSEGLNRGVVVNIEKTVKAINRVLDQAEQQSGIKIKHVYAGIAGDHIESFQTRGIVGVADNKNREISRHDVERLLEETRGVAIPSEREILHIMPQDFLIDGQDGITDPIGMSGVRMEANVLVVTGLTTAIQNMRRCIERAGRQLSGIVLEPLASSGAVLTKDEKEVGVALVDIGGGTTDIAIFEEHIIRHASVFGLAGRQVTDDVRKGLGVIVSQAEKVKREYGHSFLPSILKNDVFMIPGIGGRRPMEIRKTDLCEIIQPRMEEIFEFALAEIEKSGYASRLGAGVVITGGTTLLRGTEELAHEIFKMPVKIGIPDGITYSGLAPEIESPIYSTVTGLAIYGLEKERDASLKFNSAMDTEKHSKISNSKNKDEEKSEQDSNEDKDSTKGSIFKKFTNALKEL